MLAAVSAIASQMCTMSLRTRAHTRQASVATKCEQPRELTVVLRKAQVVPMLSTGLVPMLGTR